MSDKDKLKPTDGSAPGEASEAEQTPPEEEAIVQKVGEQQVADLEAQLEEAKAQAAEYLDGWQRARAELANFKKRMEREKAQWEEDIRGEVLSSLLEVLDDFDRAMDNLPDEIADHDWVDGIRLIHRKLWAQLEALGLREIEVEEGQPFDPRFHEAVTHEQSDDHEEGTVIEVLRKGYMINDRVLRHAMVRVAS